MPRWTVPTFWVGQTVAIMASGPSMTPEIAAAVRAKGWPTVVVNNTHRLAPWADILYAADREWWTHPSNRDAREFVGLRVTCSPFKELPDLLRLQHTGITGFDTNPGAIRTGSNSGYQALHICGHTGAARVVLFGFDMHLKKGHHWHGKHVEPLRSTNSEVFTRMASHFDTIAGPLKERGVEVINATPGSAVTCFPIVTPESVLA